MSSSEQELPRIGNAELVVDLLAEVWESIASLGDVLSERDWDRLTECPGWTVRDQVSHVVGTERMLLGEQAPPPSGAKPEHVRNMLGEVNESWVAARRSLAGSAVLDELRQVTGRRLEELRAFPPEHFEEIGWSPVGQVPYRTFMEIRVMDCWVHEQDIRVATGRPGHGGGRVAELAIDRMMAAMPFVVGKKASAPDGSAVEFDVGGEVVRRTVVQVREGRAMVIAGEAGQGGVDGGAVSVLRMDAQPFWRLSCGRVDPYRAMREGMVELEGDAELGRRVVENMAFMV
jgi:uncharacterized protein (TIGR03083 family)